MPLIDILPSGLKKKTIIPVILILIISMTCVAAFNYYSQVTVLNAEADDSLTSAINTAQGFIESHTNRYKQMATLLAHSPVVGEALSNNDRSRLMQEYLESYKALKKDIHLNQMNFHRPPGVALLRLQNPENFGDNLAQVRRTIADVYKNQAGVKGLEFGRTGLGLRGVEPVFVKGTFIGSLEFGGDLAPALDDAKQAFGVECGILISKTATSLTKSMPDRQGSAKPIGEHLSFYSTSQTLTMGLITAGMIDKAAKQGPSNYLDTAEFQGKDYSIGYRPAQGLFGKCYRLSLCDEGPVASAC